MQVHEIKGFIQSMYLIAYPDKLLLLDSGTKADVEIVYNYIENTLNRKREDLKVVLVTHVHPDHSGGAMEFKRLGVKIAGDLESNIWYQGFGGLVTYLIDIFLAYLVFFKIRKGRSLKNIFFARHVDYDYSLKEGDVIPGFEDWEILETPGHTHRDLSAYHKESSTIYVADNIIGKFKSIVTPYPINFPDLYKNSLKRYTDLGVMRYLLAHYSSREITPAEIENLIRVAPNKEISHHNSLGKIVKGLVKSFFK
ncbi:MAG: MBL fold metallo-hydrolase [Bdellovibrionota bacterium]|nr:MBL fold metallo-hydrolase [Bdellovibrionota bacterium]